MGTDRVQAVLATLAVAGVELAILLGAAPIVYRSTARGIRRASDGRSAAFADSVRTFRLRLRRLLIVICVALTSLILIYNGWLVARGVNGWIDAPSGLVSRCSPQPNWDVVTRFPGGHRA